MDVMSKGASTKIVKCIIPGSGALVLMWGFFGQKVNLHFFLNLILYNLTFRRQIKHTVMSKEEVSTVKSTDPGPGVL